MMEPPAKTLVAQCVASTALVPSVELPTFSGHLTAPVFTSTALASPAIVTAYAAQGIVKVADAAILCIAKRRFVPRALEDAVNVQLATRIRTI